MKRKKGFEYYSKVIELKARINGVKEALQSKSITIIEYREQLKIILNEVEKLSKEADNKEFLEILKKIMKRYF